MGVKKKEKKKTFFKLTDSVVKFSNLKSKWRWLFSYVYWKPVSTLLRFLLCVNSYFQKWNRFRNQTTPEKYVGSLTRTYFNLRVVTGQKLGLFIPKVDKNLIQIGTMIFNFSVRGKVDLLRTSWVYWPCFNLTFFTKSDFMRYYSSH